MGTQEHPHAPRGASLNVVWLGAATVVGTTVAATLATAAIDSWVPARSAGIALYLAAVLVVSSRLGLIAGAVTSGLSVVAFSFFFLPPRHELGITRSSDVGALAVYALAALATSRLAARVREEKAAAQRRAAEAELALESIDRLARGEDVTPVVERLQAGDAAAAAVGSSGSSAFGRRLLVAGGSAERDEQAAERNRALRAGLDELIRQRAAAAAAHGAEESLRRADATKTALLRAVSHDLRSPLQAITTAAEGLRLGELGEDDRELVDLVLEESRLLNRLVGDLLDVSRLQAGAVIPRSDWCDVSDLVNAAVRSAERRPGVVVADVPRDLPLVRGDARQLERVLANLVENATAHSPAPGSVTVVARLLHGFVRIDVSDRGPGVPEDERERIFEPFFRGAATAGRRGSGLGLAIARGLAEANAATLSIAPRTGGGTTFSLALGS